MNEPLHWNEHSPPLQRGAALACAGHALPQSPQFEVSEPKSTHEPEQGVFVPQSVAQFPLWQTSVVPQAVVHFPQWSRLAPRSKHFPLHSV